MFAPGKHPDYLRLPENISEPDVRNTYGSKTIKDHHCKVALLELHEQVPDEIKVQFETTKNIYLYAWYVFRFYPVARLHAYTCLEFALRERFGQELIAARNNKSQSKPCLSDLLHYAHDNGYLKNQEFEDWRHQARVNARARVESEAFEKMNRLDLDEIAFDDENIDIKDVDGNKDFTSDRVKSIPLLRNHYAHGSKSLDHQVLGALRLVSEIINQVFAVKSM